MDDYQFFARRYKTIENDLVEILDYIDISKNFEDCCYKIGSSKLMDFCLKVGSEVESVFRCKLYRSEFDQIQGISQKRDNQNMDIYRKVIGNTYNLSEVELVVEPTDMSIRPFKAFNWGENPQWFRTYSRNKHNKYELIKQWNLKYSLFALGGLLILIMTFESQGDPADPAVSYLDVSPTLFYLPGRRELGRTKIILQKAKR